MKFDPLQGDFSGGEVSLKFQGNVGADIYRAATSRMANAVPTRGRSFASRAGGKWLTDALNLTEPLGVQGNAGASLIGNSALDNRGKPVQHVAVKDGPYGDFVVEFGSRYMRLMDKTGAVVWHQPIYDISMDGVPFPAPGSLKGWHWISAANNDVWGDADSGAIYINNSDASAQRVIRTDTIPNFEASNTPAGTDGTWNFSGKLAGDSVTLRVEMITGERAEFAIPRGKFDINFAPRTAVGLDSPYRLFLLSQDATLTASTLWDLKLQKSGARTAFDLTTVGAVPTLNQIRGTSFWLKTKTFTAPDTYTEATKFFAVFVGLGDIFALIWTPPADANRLDNTWSFGLLNYAVTDGSFVGSDVVAVTAYQSRLWVGVSDKQGSVAATCVGYGRANYLTTGGAFQFKFGSPAANTKIASGATPVFAFDFPVGDKTTVLASVNGVLDAVAVPPGSNVALNSDQTTIPGGLITLSGGAPGAGATVKIYRNGILAEDPLSLKLASPTGRVVWMNVLRGLVLGTTRMEKTFEQNVALAVDPATGAAFDVFDHSALGSDTKLQAENVNEKILFFQQGRQILRAASVRLQSFEQGSPQNGLLSEDVSVLGEHLLKARVRSFCYVKNPVPRMFFAFDDGTGAVATLHPQFGFVWSRFTVPDTFGGIYSVTASESNSSTQLWVGTENGCTLLWENFESDITTKTRYISQVSPKAFSRLKYDTENPLPPVMDGWSRLPWVGKGTDGLRLDGLASGGYSNISSSKALTGQQVFVMINGQVYGPYLVAADNSVAGDGLGSQDGRAFVWTDSSGVRRPQEIYVGLAYPEHRIVTLPLEGGDPAGSAQGNMSRRVQFYLRLVDSYAPIVGLFRTPERGGVDPTDIAGGRITGDRRVTQLGFQRAATLEILQDKPLRMEISAIFGGTVTNSP